MNTRGHFGIKKRYWAHIYAAGFSLLVIAPLMLMALDRSPVLQFFDQGVITPNPAPSGSEVRIAWEAAQLRRCDGRVNRQVVNLDTGIITDYEWQDVVFRGDSLGERRRYSRAFVVPDAPGRYQHRAHVERWCNWLQKLVPALRLRETNSVIEFTVGEDRRR